MININNAKRKRGFAVMDPEKQRQIAHKGGVMAHKMGVAHKWNTEEAKAAGRKGGKSKRTDLDN